MSDSGVVALLLSTENEFDDGTYIQELLGTFLKHKMWYLTVGKKKKIHYSCEDGIKKSVPCDHRLSSLGKPRDAKQVDFFHDGRPARGFGCCSF